MAEHSAHEPPGLPEIVDEAADTPMWVPILGASLLATLALFLVYQLALATPEAAPAEAPEAAQDAAAAPDEPPARGE